MALPLSYNIRSIRVRWQVTLLAVLGIAVVVVVFAVLMSMSAGFTQALRATGRTDNAIVVQRGSNSELTSWIAVDHRNTISVDPRVARGADGRPLASPDIVIVMNKPKKDGEPTNVTVRGVTPLAFQVRSDIRIVRGRNFAPGLSEIIVGEKISDRIAGLGLGSSVRLQKRDFQVVGVFTSDGSAFESEIWGDHDVMAPAFERNGGSSSLTLRLRNPAELADLDRTIRANPQMQLQAVSERKYYEEIGRAHV